MLAVPLCSVRPEHSLAKMPSIARGPGRPLARLAAETLPGNRSSLMRLPKESGEHPGWFRRPLEALGARRFFSRDVFG
jgi:hypothetical protein